MTIAESFQVVKKFGLLKGGMDLACRSLFRICKFTLLEGMTLEPQDAEQKYNAIPDGFTIRIADESSLRELSLIEPVELSAAFLNSVSKKGDLCVGVYSGTKLVSFGWYSDSITEISEGVLLQFDPRYVYMYKGYTVPAFRGQNLHAYGMAFALSYFVRAGFKGLISYVEANNFRSLQSCDRLGYRRFGKVAIYRIFGKWCSFRTPGCRAYGFRAVCGERKLVVQAPA